MKRRFVIAFILVVCLAGAGVLAYVALLRWHGAGDVMDPVEVGVGQGVAEPADAVEVRVFLERDAYWEKAEYVIRDKQMIQDLVIHPLRHAQEKPMPEKHQESDGSLTLLYADGMTDVYVLYGFFRVTHGGDSFVVDLRALKSHLDGISVARRYEKYGK